MKAVDTTLAVLMLLLGTYIVISGIDYGFTRHGAPGPGFFPICVGVGVMVLSAVNIVRSLSGLEKLQHAFDTHGVAKTVGILIVLIVFLATVHYLGMLLGSALLIVALGLVIFPTLDRSFLKYLIPVAVLFPVGAYLLFSVTLGVRLIKGPFGF